MGARANYILIKDNQVLAFYDHWGAGGVVSLFGGGPKVCSEMAEDCQPVLSLLDEDDAAAVGGGDHVLPLVLGVGACGAEPM